MPKELTSNRLKELLHYNPKTGVFIWRISKTNCVPAGSIAGYVHSSGYRFIVIDKKMQYAHRLAWLYVHGYFPENEIDHVNRERSDNKIKNLREASHVCNCRNSGLRSDNKSGIKGVSWSTTFNKWHSQIQCFGKGKSLGYYKDFTSAVCARLAGEQCLNWSGCDSSSSAYQYVESWRNNG